MATIYLRQAALKDLPILLQFEQGDITAERPFDSTLKSEQITYYNIEKLINSKKADVILAILNDEIVGSAYIKIKKAKPYLNHIKYGYLGFMYVKPEHRGKGINKLIIDELKIWARLKKINELRLDVYNENNAAIKAYEKVGFNKHLINMRLGIEE